jgi:hypothetical protein
MFRVVLLLVAALSVAAFSPAARLARSSSLRMSFENALGAQPPIGFWDPLGLLTNADQERFDNLRYVETKHGRVAMAAILGHLVTTAGYRFPGCEKFGAGIKGLYDIGADGFFTTLFIVGLIEIGYKAREEDIVAAQLKASKWDEKTIQKKLAIELNNGRAAQMGILALMVHEKLNNDPYVINSLLGSPVPFNQ